MSIASAPQAELHPYSGPASGTQGATDRHPLQITAPGSQPEVSDSFVEYGDVSDFGPILSGRMCLSSGRQLSSTCLVLDTGSCLLYYTLSTPQCQVGRKLERRLRERCSIVVECLATPGMDIGLHEGGLPMLPGLVRYQPKNVFGEIGQCAQVHRTPEISLGMRCLPVTLVFNRSTPPVRPWGSGFNLRADFAISGFGSRRRGDPPGIQEVRDDRRRRLRRMVHFRCTG